MKNKRILLSAVKKCKHNGGEEWYGYLLPQEILELRDLGVVIPSTQEHLVDIAIDRKRRGACAGVWFYFYQNDGFLKLKQKGEL